MTDNYVMGIRGEKVDESKVWSACPNCAALRGEVEHWKTEWRIEGMKVARLREAVEASTRFFDAFRYQGDDPECIEIDQELYKALRRAGEGE